MLVERPRPSTPVSGGWAAGSLLERKPRSPKGWKKRELDFIGLAIVAALEKAGRDPPARLAVGASAPIAIASPRIAAKVGVFVKDSDVGCTGRGTGGFFSVSPPACEDEPPAGGFRVVDFLSHCNLCGKRLHGKDIYMYRGEKAFCSTECRYLQIVSNEVKEKCWSGVSAATAAAASPYAGGGRLFSAGVAAA